MSDVITLVLFLNMAALVCFQQWYWSRQVQILIDKLMSRNYVEYNSVYKSEPNIPRVREEVRDFDDEAKVLEELNGMIGP